MKKILIAGASGTAGSAIAGALAESGSYRVYGLTRKEENRPFLEKMGCIPVVADLTDRAESRQAIKDVQPEVVVSSVLGGGEKAAEQEFAMGENLIRISKEANVSAFVYLSVYQSDKETGVPHFEVKARVEEQLRSSGLNYLIIRPATFMDGLFMPWFLQPVKEQRLLASPMAAGTKISYIHTRDIAALILHALQQGLSGETLELGGQPLSIMDIQHILSEKMGAEIAYRQLSLEQVRQMTSEDVALMVDYFNRNHFVVRENKLPAGYAPQLRLFENEIEKYL